MWSDASTTQLFTAFITSIGVIMLLVIGSILTLGAGLLGLGYAWTRVKKHVTGKKF